MTEKYPPPTPFGTPDTPDTPGTPTMPDLPDTPNLSPTASVPTAPPTGTAPAPSGVGTAPAAPGYPQPNGAPAAQAQGYAQPNGTPYPPGTAPAAPQQSPAPSWGYPQGYPQGYAQNAQQGYGYQQSPPPPGYAYPAYPTQQGYGYAPPPQKKKVWPWVLGGCLLASLLLFGGCIAVFASAYSQFDTNEYRNLLEDYGEREDMRDNGYGWGDGWDDELFGLDEILTRDDLDLLLPMGVEGTVTNGRATIGAYEVGKGKDLEAGLYYLEGSQTEEGVFYLFESASPDEGYTLLAPIVYFGNYYANLKEGDAIVFLAPESAEMFIASDKVLEPEKSYQSGLYRIGIDMPAGDYKVTYQKGIPEDTEGDAAAFIMKDLKWNESSILETYYVITGGSHTITVEEGQFLELYGAEASVIAVG